MKLVLLAAGKSSRIYNKIKKNKCLIKINNKSLIQNIIDNAHQCFIEDIDIVTGFKPENIKIDLKDYKDINYIKNSKYKTTDMVYSALLSLKKTKKDAIISYTDIFYERDVFKKLLKNKTRSITLPYIVNWKKVWNLRSKNIFDDAETFRVDSKSNLKEIGNKINKKNIKFINGQFMGIIYIPKEYISKVIKFYENYNNYKIQFTGFLNYLISNKIKINCIKYDKFWYEIDDYKDLNNFKKVKNYNIKKLLKNNL
jgi:L-glutamine-phosphate cytidylyltransferase